MGLLCRSSVAAASHLPEAEGRRAGWNWTPRLLPQGRVGLDSSPAPAGLGGTGLLACPLTSASRPITLLSPGWSLLSPSRLALSYLGLACCLRLLLGHLQFLPGMSLPSDAPRRHFVREVSCDVYFTLQDCVPQPSFRIIANQFLKSCQV